MVAGTPRANFYESSQVCYPAPGDGIRAQGRPFSCTSASVSSRGPQDRSRVGPRGRSEMAEIVTRSTVEIKDSRM